jgi:hypothetical protein
MLFDEAQRTKLPLKIVFKMRDTAKQINFVLVRVHLTFMDCFDQDEGRRTIIQTKLRALPNTEI